MRHHESALIRVLMSAPWRGNVRELENVLERAMLLTNGEQIDVGDLPAGVPARPTARTSDDLRTPSARTSASTSATSSPRRRESRGGVAAAGDRCVDAISKDEGTGDVIRSVEDRHSCLSSGRGDRQECLSSTESIVQFCTIFRVTH